MAGDEGTLASTAQVLLAIGQNASAEQILEANTNFWIKFAESEMSLIAGTDIVTNYTGVKAFTKQWLASVASARAAFFAINQNQNTWSLATTQSKLNVLDAIWQSAQPILKDKDRLADMGLEIDN